MAAGPIGGPNVAKSCDQTHQIFRDPILIVQEKAEGLELLVLVLKGESSYWLVGCG